VQAKRRHYADFWSFVGLASMHRESVVNSRTMLWVLLDLRGVKGTDPFWLLLGTLTGREAGRPRVVWPMRSSAISGGGLRRLTG
jgi:hypothetical protein